MPLHDWSHVKAGTDHNFHCRWISAIMDHLNSGILPADCYAMAEQVIGGKIPDVVTLSQGQNWSGSESASGLLLAEPVAKPTTSVVMVADDELYARKANQIVIRDEADEVLAVIEIVSPGNKNTTYALRTLIDKLLGLLDAGINVVIVDPLPPAGRDPQGLHGLIWQEIANQPFVLPTDRPITFVSYQATLPKTAYLEPIAVGMDLPKLPVFLRGNQYINLSFEISYMQTWNVLPAAVQRMILTPTTR